MGDLLSFELLLELPNTIVESSSKYEDYSMLLRSEIISKYYHSDLRRDILNKYINKILDAKYNFKNPLENFIDITSHLDPQLLSKPVKRTDKTSSTVIKFTEYEKRMKSIYDNLINVSIKLTREEVIYLIDSLFCNKSEEVICDKLDVSRTTFLKIKKSCLIKLANELGLINLDV